MVVMAPGDAATARDARLCSASRRPCAIRYPKAAAVEIDREVPPVQLGRSEVLHWGTDGCLVACGALLPRCLAAAEQLRGEGLDVGVVNARFVKPLDTETILRAVQECSFVVTVEEAALAGGFGSAVLEAAADAGLETSRVRRLGIPDFYIEHGERDELLADLGLDVEGIVSSCRLLADDVATSEKLR